MKSNNYIAYFRVSTNRQGVSGLGLRAQENVVENYVEGDGGALIETFTEVETATGRRRRPELEAAIRACRLLSATLIVAKVDRLLRSSGFLDRILDEKIDIRFCDLPDMVGAQGRFMLKQMANVAELEAGMISERTKAALSTVKASIAEKGFYITKEGVRITHLGSPQNLTKKAKEKGAWASRLVRAKEANRFARDIFPTIEEIRRQGVKSHRAIARKLNRKGYRTRRDCEWRGVQVKDVLIRAGAAW